MIFSEIIKNAREKSNIPLRLAAKNIGISIGYLNDLERGRALRPKMKYIYAMAGFYALDIDELCLSAERIPQDVFYKIIRRPELLNIVRNHAE